MTSSFEFHQPDIRDSWSWSEDQIHAWQIERFNLQLKEILPINRFYHRKLGDSQLQLQSLEELSSLPFTTKQELVDSASTSADGISQHHTFSSDRYSRMHRTSGTTGKPMIVLDTSDDWRRWSGTWQNVLEAAQISESDRVFLAFSFGPFIGFWSAHQACVDRGATVIPGGGLSSLARLEFMKQSQATVMFATPSYALHLGEVAKQENISLRDLGVRKIVVAGEAGGSVPAVRERIEAEWQAHVIDHSGATEIGPWGFGWPDRIGLHIIETSFIAELIPIAAITPNDSGESESQLSELVITSLARTGAPVIRYRTGDAVQAVRPTTGPCRFLWLPNGVVGRTDNMVTIRGVNVFPSSIDAVVRTIPEVIEYQVTLTRECAMDQLSLKIEAATPNAKSQLEKALGIGLGLRIPTSVVPAGSLPRSELKSQRWHDLRQ